MKGEIEMASAKQAKEFIAKISPIIQAEAKKRGYKVASAIIAQACIESAFGTSSLGYKYHNYFGMKCGNTWKGKSVNLSTKEEYTVGQLTNIKANFRVYDSMEAGVAGYFDFISAKRYSNLKNATTAEQYLTYIKNDGYATSSTYVNTNMNVVRKYNLETWDNFAASSGVPVAENKPVGETYTIVNCVELNIRTGVGTIYPAVGRYKKGDKVVVYETKKNGTTKWGRTDKGWISMKYTSK